jgi:hypothetical protein
VAIGINATAFFVIAAPENQRVLQNNVGWERTYKPMLHDRLQPEVAVFGASWARDAFDYEETTQILGRPFFNHAVSGGQAYENRRFMQSALAGGRLQAVMLNVDSFLRRSNQLKFQYGFNEGLLNVDPAGQANSGVQAQRFFASTLSGAAIGNNVSAMGILRQFRGGKPKNELLRAYDRHDFAARADRVALWRRSVLEGQPTGEGQPAPFTQAEFDRASEELALAVDLACQAGVRVIAYWTPSHAAIVDRAIDQTELKSAVWRLLAARLGRCPGGLALHDFNYPNLVSLEAVLDGAPQGRYFRTDGHPRPTVGELMTSVMFQRPGPGAGLQDFGQQDLLALDTAAALAWIERREARWRGQWTDEDRAALRNDLDRTQDHGAPGR